MKREQPAPQGLEKDLEAVRALTAPILAWYARRARTLPWRSLPTPYRVWVSEIMLQQTRVEAVLPYFERFMAALPDVEALAAAPEEQLLKLWEGLGYYSRVRNLQRAARAVVGRYGGALPAAPEELMALPGIGEYTAGAVASIAFGAPVAAVDGNVLRVLARVLACAEDITRPGTVRRFRALAQAMVPVERPGDFNQAMMDLGATVCLPNGAPLCGQCPAAERCAARREGTAGLYPVKPPKKPRDVRRRTVFVIRCGGRVLLRRRASGGLLAGLWELPGEDGWLDERAAAEALRRWGCEALELRPLGAAKHIFTHVEWHMRGYLARVRECAPGPGWAWADGRALRETYALPSAFRAYGGELPGGGEAEDP